MNVNRGVEKAIDRIVWRNGWGWTCCEADLRVYKRRNEWMDGWNKWMNGRMDERMDGING